MKNIHTQSEDIPDQIDGTYPPTREQLLAAGWRDGNETPPPDPLPGYTRVCKPRWADLDGVNGQWVIDVPDRLTAEVDAEKYAQDLAENGPRYVTENQYIILCDVLRVALGGQASREKLGFEELPMMMLALKAGNHTSYEQLRDAMDMLNSALIRYDVRWWDNAVWHPQPELTEASNAIMGMV